MNNLLWLVPFGVCFGLPKLEWVATHPWYSILFLGIAMYSVVPALLEFTESPWAPICVASWTLFLWGRFQASHDPLVPMCFLLAIGLLAAEVWLTPGLGKLLLAGALSAGAGIWLAYTPAGSAEAASVVAALGLTGGCWSGFGALRRRGQLALLPPSEVDSRFQPGLELQVYLGKTGLTRTALKPSGSVDLEGRVVGARSEGGYLPAGVAVRVVGIDQTQVLVDLDPDGQQTRKGSPWKHS